MQTSIQRTGSYTNINKIQPKSLKKLHKQEGLIKDHKAKLQYL